MKTILYVALSIICILSSANIQAKMGIRTMFDGSQVIEVAEIRQLTTLDDGSVGDFHFSPDGRSIAYVNTQESGSTGITQRARLARLAIVHPSGGRSTVLLDAMRYEDNAIPNDKDVIMPESVQQFAWSPDSKSIALSVRLCRETQGNQWGAILLINRNGTRRASFNLPKDAFVISSLVWSPNGRKIAVSVVSQTADSLVILASSRIMIFDTNTNTPPTSVNRPEHMLNLEKFTDDSKGLVCTVVKDRSMSRIEIPIFGQPIKTIEEKISSDEISPNGFYKLVPDKPGVTIQHIASKREIPLIVKPDSSFINWSPNSNLFSFAKAIELKDDTDSRSETLGSLWIGLLRESKYNHMYVMTLEPNQDGYMQTEWSPDGLMLAYVSQDHLYTARLIARPPDIGEKVDLGIPLDEKELQFALLANAKQIGLGIMMYAQDYDENFPDAATLEKAIEPYVKSMNVFRSPNGGALSYEYFQQPNMSQIEKPAETVLMRIPSGYDWEIEIYADGHVRSIKK